jgi:dephospho-CoA kinase
MLRVGITGGIGSGKTTACKVFETLGIPVYYSDDESKKLLDSDELVKGFIVSEFGAGVLDTTGHADRKKIAERVFADPALLGKLNSVVHPAVAKHFENWVKQQHSKYVLKEAAILFESGADKQVDLVITVLAPEELRITRAMNRLKIDRSEVVRRMSNQTSDEEKAKRSEFTLINDEVSLLIPQILELHRVLLNNFC